MKQVIRLLFLLFIFSSHAYPKLWMPAIFNNQMVLQQNTEVKLWGKGEKGQPVEVKSSWLGKTYKVIPDDSGCWSLEIKTLQANNIPYQLQIKQGKERLVFDNILFGEVWLCTGQSNMEMKLKGYYGQPITGGREAIANGTNNRIRLFTVEKAYSHEPQTNCKGEWQQATPLSVSEFSAAAYFFGQQLEQTLDVPVGLIAAPWGGASIEAYMSKESLQNFPSKKIPLLSGDIKKPNLTPTALYNGMIHPIIGFGMKGCIWYQGESNRQEPELYKQLYKAMLASWRSAWNIGDFPVYYAQIAPYTYGNGNSAFFREAQALCEKENINTAMICLLDVGEPFDIHPSGKQTVGLRFAYTALSKTYGVEGIVSDGPVYQSMKIEGNKVHLTFENAKSGLTTYRQPLDQFQVAGADQVFYPATILQSRQNVILYSDKVPNPVAVRYGFTDYVKGTLYNVEGCPASSFRTDTWEK